MQRLTIVWCALPRRGGVFLDRRPARERTPCLFEGATADCG